LSGSSSLGGEGRNAQSSARINQASTPKKATRRTKRKSFHGPQDIENLVSGEDMRNALLLKLRCQCSMKREEVNDEAKMREAVQVCILAPITKRSPGKAILRHWKFHYFS
jgi:hypothetical protein